MGDDLIVAPFAGRGSKQTRQADPWRFQTSRGAWIETPGKCHSRVSADVAPFAEAA